MFPIRKSLLIVAAIVVIFGAQQLAQADPLVLSLTNPSLTGVAGGSVTLVASATNCCSNSNTVTIIGIIPNGPPTFSIDGSPFIANWFLQTVTFSNTRGPLALFTLNIPVGTPDGNYQGNAQLVYTSANPGAVLSNIEFFAVNVVSGPAPIPEPATMLLLGSGLVGIAAKVRKRRKSV